MRISDWSSDVCSSDLRQRRREAAAAARAAGKAGEEEVLATDCFCFSTPATSPTNEQLRIMSKENQWIVGINAVAAAVEHRSEEHTPELQSLMSISYAVFCLKKKNTYHIKEP